MSSLRSPLSLAVCLLVSACGGGAGSGFGASPGGVQDLRFARDLVDKGYVPPAEALKVEAMFAEHDLPLEGQACTTVLCLRNAVAIAPDENGQLAGWLQVGLSSTIDPESYVRPSVALIMTVDVSGSMGWNYSDDAESASPGKLSRELLRAIAGNLEARDRIAIVTYGSDVDVTLDLTRGDDRGAINGAIDELDEDGSTNMEAGMERAYELAREARDSGVDRVRIMLFTDAQPNVGRTDPSEFERMVVEGAGAGIGITVFGVGLGLGAELMNSMAHVRGANAFSLTETNHVPELMEQSWPWMVSEIAQDLSLLVEVNGGLNMGATYGFPESGTGTSVNVTSSSVFLSRNRGALLVRFDGASENLMKLSATSKLNYLELDGTAREQILSASLDQPMLGESSSYFQQRGVQQAVALAVLMRSLQEAATVYRPEPARALEIAERAVVRFEADAAALAEPAFARELEFAKKLRDLIGQNAPQGDLYSRI